MESSNIPLFLTHTIGSRTVDASNSNSSTYVHAVVRCPGTTDERVKCGTIHNGNHKITFSVTISFSPSGYGTRRLWQEDLHCCYYFIDRP